MTTKPKPKQIFQETTYHLPHHLHIEASKIEKPKTEELEASRPLIALEKQTQQPKTSSMINAQAAQTVPATVRKPVTQIKKAPTPTPTSNSSQNEKKQTSSEKKQKLKSLLDLADKLEKHATTTDQIDKIHWSHPHIEVLSSSTTVAQQEIAFCQLLQKYITLPCQGAVRIKITFEQGMLRECLLLSPMSELDKQNILSQLHKIPFQHFFNQYNASKNMVFHIKLRSDES